VNYITYYGPLQIETPLAKLANGDNKWGLSNRVFDDPGKNVKRISQIVWRDHLGRHTSGNNRTVFQDNYLIRESGSKV